VQKEYCCISVNTSNRILDRHAHWCHLASTVKLLCEAARIKSATSDGERGYLDANDSMSLGWPSECVPSRRHGIN